MGHADLMAIVAKLPLPQQAQVLDFAESLAAKLALDTEPEAPLMAELIARPLLVGADFKVFKRAALYDRTGIR